VFFFFFWFENSCFLTNRRDTLHRISLKVLQICLSVLLSYNDNRSWHTFLRASQTIGTGGAAAVLPVAGAVAGMVVVFCASAILRASSWMSMTCFVVDE